MANSKLVVNRRSQLVAKGTSGQDEIVDIILSGSVPELADLYALSKDIFSDDVQRSYVEASLLTKATFSEIAETLEIPEEVIIMYHDMFYSVMPLTRLERLSVLTKEKNADIRQFKSWALTQGIEFIKWRIGGDAKVTPIGGLSSLFKDAYYKSKEAFFNANEAEASREAAKWTKQAAELARLLKAWTTDEDEARKDIEIALKSITEEDIKFEDIDELGIELYQEASEKSEYDDDVKSTPDSSSNQNE